MTVFACEARPLRHAVVLKRVLKRIARPPLPPPRRQQRRELDSVLRVARTRITATAAASATAPPPPPPTNSDDDDDRDDCYYYSCYYEQYDGIYDSGCTPSSYVYISISCMFTSVPVASRRTNVLQEQHKRYERVRLLSSVTQS